MLATIPETLSPRLLSKSVKIRTYKTIMLPVVLYGCETWSLALRDGHRRRMFVPKRDEMMGGWRKLHNEELCDLYSLPSIIRMVKSRRMRGTGHVARMGGGGERVIHMGY
jgi:hypothetical protein